jgi:hypothetical protein
MIPVRFLNRVLWIGLAFVNAASAVSVGDYDDPVASLSRYDRLDRILNSNFPFEHVELVFHACTYGAASADSQYKRHKAQLSHLHLLWGAYGFAHDERERKDGKPESPERQAAFFVRNVQESQSEDDHLVLLSINWSWYKKDYKAITPRGVAIFCAEVHRLTGVWPVLFVDIDLLKSVLQDPSREPWTSEERVALSKCPLWLGYLDTDEPFPPVLPKNSPWESWTFCLHSSSDYPATVDAEWRQGSLPPDLSWFNGSRGAVLKDWYESHSWDYKVRGP